MEKENEVYDPYMALFADIVIPEEQKKLLHIHNHTIENIHRLSNLGNALFRIMNENASKTISSVQNFFVRIETFSITLNSVTMSSVG